MTFEEAIGRAAIGERILWVVAKNYRQRERDLIQLSEIANEQGCSFKLNRPNSELRFDGGGFIKLYTDAQIDHGHHKGFEWHWCNEPDDMRAIPYVRAK